MKARLLAAVLVVAVGALAFYFRGRGGATSPAPQVPTPGGAPAAPSPSSGAPTSSAPRPGTPPTPAPVVLEQDPPFRWDDRRPVIDQVRELLKAVDTDPEMVRGWRSRPEEVASAVATLLLDATSTSNMREMGLMVLRDLKRPGSVPVLLDLARRDADEDLRADAIRTLGAFRGQVRAGEVRALYPTAKSDEEKAAVMETLGELGDPESLPLLEATAKEAADAGVRQEAARGAEKLRIESSPQRDVELARILREEKHPLREWSLGRIVAGGKPEGARQLREALETHRKGPKSPGAAAFEYRLLKGLQALGQSLEPSDQARLEAYENSGGR